MIFQKSSSALFKNCKLEQYFFYKKTIEGVLSDFKAPLDEKLAFKLLDDFDLKKLLVLQQNHTAHIVCYPSQQGYKYADGIMTDQKKVGLLIRHADCQAAFFFDPKKNVIAAVHAGFRGQVLNIYTNAIKALKKNYGSHPQDLLVAISPSLGLDHAEFKNYKDEFPERLHKYLIDGYMDLKKMAFDELIMQGIKAEHIDIDQRCSYCDEDLFFSYRKNKTESRLGSLIFLNK